MQEDYNIALSQDEEDYKRRGNFHRFCEEVKKADINDCNKLHKVEHSQILDNEVLM